MKNLKKIFILTIIAGFIYSCDDAYDIVQEGEFTEDLAFETVADMASVMSEVYDQVTTEDIIAFTSIITDETGIADGNGGQNLDEYRFQLFPTNDFASAIWGDNYRVINYANRLIRGSENVILDPESDTYDSDLAAKNSILAEARALRAFSHMQLLTFYSVDLKNDAGLGVIILDHVPPSLPNLEELPRSTNAEVFAFIEQDLAYAEENLQDSGNAVLVTKNFINAMRARIAAYRGRYEEAKTYADLVLSAIPDASELAVNVNAPTSATPYRGIWTDTSLTEIIFGLERPAGKITVGSNWFFNRANYDGGPFLDMGRELYNKLTENPGDFRGQVFVGSTSKIAEDYATVFDYRNADVIIINKYPGVSAALPLNNRIKVFRTPEMFFIKAEAEVAAGNLEAARTLINKIRTARNTTTLDEFADTQAAWKAILDERRLELCFEGHRYIDLKRLGTLAGVPGVQRYIRDCEPYSSCELLVSDHRFTLPIPNDELNGNSVIQQNPGY